MSITLTEQIGIEVRRCYTCGRWYGYEQGQQGGCNMCTNKFWRNAQTAVTERDRTISALKGALTKAKRRRSKR